MSAALFAQPDRENSTMSNGTHPDISLGSLASGFSTPARNIRVPSSSSHTTAQSSAPIATPSPPAISTAFTRRKTEDATALARRLGTLSHLDEETQEEGDDLLDTPGAEKKRWADGPDTPMATRPKRTRASVGATLGGTKGSALTLRDQEKHIDNLKKENFNIKLRVHFLEERLASLAPEQTEAALKQNINLKIEVQQRGMEMKKLKKLVLELERELQRAGGTKDHQRELEEKLEERERELSELRARLRNGGRGGGGVDEEAFKQMEERNVVLEKQLENVRGLLEENVDEMERLRELVERRGDESLQSDGEGRRERLKRRVEELEGENEELRARLDEHGEIIVQKEDEREDLMDEIGALRLEVEDLHRKREAESYERSESRAQVLEEREEREAVEDDMNALRDRLAAVMIELQQKEDDVEVKSREIQELVLDHRRIVESVEDDWKGEVEEAKGQVEELRDVLAEREAESKELRLNISELEANTNDLHAKFEAALAHLEQESEQKDAEIEALNQTIEKLSEQIYLIEDENDRIKEDSDRQREDDSIERERLEALTAALKEKISTIKSQLQETTELYETCSNEIHAHRSRQEELARHVEDLVAEAQREQQLRERAESELEAADREHEAEQRSQRRLLSDKEGALQNAMSELARTQGLLSQREGDLQAVQSSLQTLEAESKRLGETHTTARFSLQLEADRLKRDLERVEDELGRARKELEEREGRGREREGALDGLHADNRDLRSQLAAQTQARLNIAEKLDKVQGDWRAAEAEAGAMKTRVSDLEGRLSKDQRALLSVESQYRDQLTERNTLLLTIYQYMDKILGVDKTPKKGGQAETKPFTNFGVFHDNLITRLKALSQIQLDFDKRCKEVEARFVEKMNDMRKQLDNRWKQIDKFEASVKSYADTKVSWRRKFSAKEGELEAVKATNAEMAAQLTVMKRPGQSSETMELRSLSTRAVNAERRLNISQNQLLAVEEKFATTTQSHGAAIAKWEARVKEYEGRIKAEMERTKNAKQGGKERVLELEGIVRSLKRQLELANKRSQQLEDIDANNKLSGLPSGSSPSRS